MEAHYSDNELIRAITERDFKEAKRLIKKDPLLINHPNDRSQTALHHAAYILSLSPGDKEARNIYAYLIENGADVNHRDDNGLLARELLLYARTPKDKVLGNDEIVSQSLFGFLPLRDQWKVRGAVDNKGEFDLSRDKDLTWDIYNDMTPNEKAKVKAMSIEPTGVPWYLYHEMTPKERAKVKQWNLDRFVRDRPD